VRRRAAELAFRTEIAVDDHLRQVVVRQIDAPALRRIDPGGLALDAADGLDRDLSRLMIVHVRDFGAEALLLNWTCG
jgi:hypothetical protein